MPPDHPLDAEGQYYGHDRRQPLRYGGDREAYGHKEHVEYWLATQDAEEEDDCDDNTGGVDQKAAELLKPLLQRGRLGLYLLQEPGDLAHLCSHARLYDYALPPAVNYMGARIGHVCPVGQRKGVIKGLCLFFYGVGLSCEGGFGYLKEARFYYPAVCRHMVPAFEDDYITGYQVPCLDRGERVIPQDLGVWGGEFFKRVHDLRGLGLLHEADYAVKDDYAHDGQRVYPFSKEPGYGGGAYEDKYDEVGELLEEFKDRVLFFLPGELVVAVFGQTAFGLGVAEPALGVCRELRDYGFGLFLVPVHRQNKKDLYGAIPPKVFDKISWFNLGFSIFNKT